MTLERFNYIVDHAYQMGRIASSQFHANEVHNEIVEFEGFNVCYQNKGFLWMETKEGKAIKKEDCTIFDVEEMSDFELEQLMKDAQKVMKKRQIEEATKAMDEFTRAWEKLKQFKEIRIRVSATGEKHIHTTVERLGLEFLPLK